MASLQSYPTVTATASILCGLMLMLPGRVVSSNQLVNFIEEPGDLLLLPGQTGWLYCRVDVYGAKITWLSNGVPRFHDQKSFGADGSQISINGSRSTGMDSWQCAAEVPGWGTVLSRKNLVRFVHLLSFKTEPQDQQVIAGNVARFKCSVNKFPEAEITWLKDDEILKWDTERMTSLTTGTLEIDNFNVRDIGCYHCNASFGGTTVSSRKGCVTVLTPSFGSNSPIKFIAEPRDISARYGETVLLECVATGYPKPIISWYKEEGLSVVELYHNEMDFTVFPSGTLELKAGRQGRFPTSSARTLGTTYICTAEHGGIGRGYREARATVTINRGAYQKSGRTILSKNGTELELNCKIHSHELLTFTWFKNGREMFRRQQDSHLERFKLDAKNGNLKILNLQFEDAGMYQCEGQDSEGATFLTQPEQIFVVEDASLIDHCVRTSVCGSPLSFLLESGKVMNYASNLKADPTDSNYGSVDFRWDGPTDEKSKKFLIGYHFEYGCCREEVDRKKWTRSRPDHEEYRSCSQSNEGVDRWLNLHRLSRLKTTLTHVQTAFQPGDTKCLGRVRAMTMNGIEAWSDWVSYPPEALNETDVPDPPSNLHVTVTWEEGWKRGNNVSISWSPPENQTFWVRSYVVEWMQWDEDYKKDSRKRQRLWPTQLEFQLSIDETSYSEISVKASNLAGESTAILIHVNIRFHDTIFFTMESQSSPSWNLPDSPLKRVEVVLDSDDRGVLSWSFGETEENTQLCQVAWQCEAQGIHNEQFNFVNVTETKLSLPSLSSGEYCVVSVSAWGTRWFPSITYSMK